MIAYIPLLPLIGFAINGLWYGLFQTRQESRRASALTTGSIATAAIFGSFLISLKLFLDLNGMAPESRSVEVTLFNWMKAGDLNVDVALRFDTLSSLFCLVITGVGSLIHLYSIGYMSHDETPGKFFAYLNLFCFAMLMLVLGSSLPILFLGWEGVGLCSYLLIGYWYTDPEKASAGKKAFIVNRIGDFGFLLGMFLIYTTFGGMLDFAAIKTAATTAPAAEGIVTAICLLLFLGCTGKSAQIPLYIWLPDAMAGPTPVSALIHAATMVTSGIYMITRLNFLFTMSHTAMTVIAVIGAATALFAATIAIVQNDIKKVLAYSTVSQLGYMFLACGVGAYTAGVFHVITHAFFKALLFLGSGSVIHGMHEEQDIQKMGGLKKYMPHTYKIFLVGWLAICGFPGLSGFFSKDEILWVTFSSEHGSKLLWVLAVLTALMTAFYMTRLFSLTFLGKERFKVKKGHSKDHGKDHSHAKDSDHAVDVHESPWVMLFPLYVLAGLSIFGGLIGIPHMSWLEHWLEPVIPAHAASHAPAYLEWLLMGVMTLMALGMMFWAKNFFTKDGEKIFTKKLGGLHPVLMGKWYVDELYEVSFVKPIYVMSVSLWKNFDIQVIDRIVLGFGRVSAWSGQVARVFQTGSVQNYALIASLGFLGAAFYLLSTMVK